MKYLKVILILSLFVTNSLFGCKNCNMLVTYCLKNLQFNKTAYCDFNHSEWSEIKKRVVASVEKLKCPNLRVKDYLKNGVVLTYKKGYEVALNTTLTVSPQQMVAEQEQIIQMCVEAYPNCFE